MSAASDGDCYIARTRPGTDFPTRFERLLSQTDGHLRSDVTGVIPVVSDGEDERLDFDDSPILATVRDVLKYSRTCIHMYRLKCDYRIRIILYVAIGSICESMTAR